MTKYLCCVVALFALVLAPAATSQEHLTRCGKVAVEGELIAQRQLEDGTIKHYYRTPASIVEMNRDFIALMKQQGVPETVYMKAPYATYAMAETLCGGTKDCGSKKCPKGNCVYKNIGMAGCACDG